jgi:lipopolysaccharide/colanic/teichoic acid biosynthesis glycosyltransferase
MSTDALALACPPAPPLVDTSTPQPASDRSDADLTISVQPATGWYTRGKPIFDFLLALTLLPPAIVLVAIAAVVVKLTSAGPAFYTQTRVGQNGRRFVLIKLRTMRHRCEAASGPRWSPPNDNRVTPVGRFLRATHLDELPQLWNVLRGDMSLIGPRPERPEIIEAENLNRLVPGYSERLAVRPGLTGLAQLQYPPDTDIASVRRKIASDLDYIEQMSLVLDLRILVGTVLAAVGAGPHLLRRVLALPGPWQATTPSHPATHGSAKQWGDTLAALLTHSQSNANSADGEVRAEVRQWFRSTATPALYELARELRQHGRRVRISANHAEETGIRVWNPNGERELDLKLRVRSNPCGFRVYARELVRDGRQTFVHEHFLERPVTEISRADVIAFIIARYRANAASGS